jgi:hypothetical protein
MFKSSQLAFNVYKTFAKAQYPTAMTATNTSAAPASQHVTHSHNKPKKNPQLSLIYRQHILFILNE